MSWLVQYGNRQGNAPPGALASGSLVPLASGKGASPVSLSRLRSFGPFFCEEVGGDSD